MKMLLTASMYGAAFAARRIKAPEYRISGPDPFVELDHGFQLTVVDGRFLILPDVFAVFTLTSQIRLSKGCMPIGKDLSPEAFPHWFSWTAFAGSTKLAQKV